MKKISIILVLTIVFLVNCEREIIKIIEDTDPPVILEPLTVLEVTDTSAILYWETDEPCSSVVCYWQSGDTNMVVLNEDQYRQSHRFELIDLKDSTLYRCFATSFDLWGNFTSTDTVGFLTVFNFIKYLGIAWNYFENGDYQSSLNYFYKYLEYDSTSLDAYIGIGWSKLFIDKTDSTIFQDFIKVLGSLNPHRDAICGAALYGYYDSIYVFVIEQGEQLLQLDSTYVFQHDTSINYIDIYVILARAYFMTGDIEDCFYYLGKFSDIDSLVSIEPDPDDSETWTIGEHVFETYEDAYDRYLIEVNSFIERVESIYLPDL